MMAPMPSTNTMQLNVVETARKYEALVAAAFDGNTARSSGMETDDEVRIETNALFHVRDLRKLFERVHGPLAIRESSVVKGGRAIRQSLRFGVYDIMTARPGDTDADAAQDDQGGQDEHHDDQEDREQTHEPQGPPEETQQHECDQTRQQQVQPVQQVPLPVINTDADSDASVDQAVDDRSLSTDVVDETEAKIADEPDEADDGIASDFEVKATHDDDFRDEMNGEKSTTERFLAFALALALVMRMMVAVGTTAVTWLAAILRWLVLSLVWWISAVLLPEAVALVVAIVAVSSVIMGVSSRTLAVANRACTMYISPLTLALFHGGVHGGKWCWRTSCQLWAACSAIKTVMVSPSKSKKDDGLGTISGSKTNCTETQNKVLVHADLAQLSPPSPPDTTPDTDSASETDPNSESGHQRGTETETETETETDTDAETEMLVQVVMRSSPPSDQHAAMGLGLIDTVDRSTLSLSVTGVSGSVDAAEEEEGEEEGEAPSQPVPPLCVPAVSATATATRAVAPVASSVAPTHRRRTFPKGKRVNHGLPYGQNVQSVYLKYETLSPSYARNLAGALATRKALAVPPQAQSQGQVQASRGWR